MQGDEDTASVIRVDDETLLRDAHRLIFDSEHSTAELLELLTTAAASPDPHFASPHSTTRRVTISEDVTVFHDSPTEVLDLPPALALMYYVAVAEASAPHLQYVLETLGSPAPPVPRGNALYEAGLRHKEESVAWREEQRRSQAEAETRECTFKPLISPAAQEVAPKGLQTFMQKCVEWKKDAAARLVKKAALDRMNRGEDEWMTPWKMGERTRELAEKARAKGKVRGKLWEPKTPCGAAYSLSPTTQESALETPSYRPVVRGVDASSVAQLLASAPDARSTSCGSHRTEQNQSHMNSSCCSGRGGVTYLQRVEADKQRRQSNLERLRAYYASVEAQRLFEPDTGQPLFEPNALPTVLRGNTRVPFEELSRDERRAVGEQLRRAHRDYLLARLRRGASEPRGGRSADELLARLHDRSARARRVARLHAEDCAAAPFRPSLSARTERLVERAARVPVHERPLRRPPPPRATPPPRRGLSPNGSGRDEAFRRTLARAEEWAAGRARRLERGRLEAEERQMAPCSFRPQCATRTQAVGGADRDALAASAAARMRSEVELLRLQAALRDEGFMRSAGGSLTSVTLSSAPRPSRRSVEQYAGTGRSPHKYAPSQLPSQGDYSRFDAHDTWDGEIESDGNGGDYDCDDEEELFEEFAEYDTQEEEENVRQLADSWADLDAQTDSILRNCLYY